MAYVTKARGKIVATRLALSMFVCLRIRQLADALSRGEGCNNLPLKGGTKLLERLWWKCGVEDVVLLLPKQ
jgi:hypothetical protein